MKFTTPMESEPFALTIEQFRQRYPSSRASVSNWIKSGELPSFVDGRRRLISFQDARDFVSRRAKAGGGPIPPEVSAQKSAAGRKGRASQLGHASESETR